MKYNVYKAILKENGLIVGLMSLDVVKPELRIEIRLLESAEENIGKGKMYGRIAGCLIAYACKLSFKSGFGGFISLIPKTELISYYQEAYHFFPMDRHLALDGKETFLLIEKYLEYPSIMKRINRNHTQQDLAEVHIFPHGLSVKEKQEADKDLLALRKERWNNRSPKQQLRDNLLQLKYQMEEVIESSIYRNDFHYGHFLSSYIRLTHKKQNEFAQEISIDEARLSRIIHRKEWPNEELFIRMELHSKKIIPAIYWFKLVEKEKVQQLSTDSEIMYFPCRSVKERIISLICRYSYQRYSPFRMRIKLAGYSEIFFWFCKSMYIHS